MDKIVDHLTLKAFIQDVLGCGCPEEIFENMTCQKEILAGTPGTLINVGGRLLVFLWRLTDPADISKTLKNILKAGKSKRDTHGFNRLRLVLLTNKSAIVPEDLQKRFLELIGDDEKVHLHVLHSATVPTFIQD